MSFTGFSAISVITTNCNPNGAFIVKFAPGVYTACSPVWSVVKKSEPAAFNAMLSPALSTQPLVMHAGDTITAVMWRALAAELREVMGK